MQRKTKNFLTKLIIVLLICSAALYVALHVRINEYADPKTEDTDPEKEEIIISDFVEPEIDKNYSIVGFNFGEFLDKDIYINGYHINNWELTDPFIIVDEKIYVPMSASILKALGLKAELDDDRHLAEITKSGDSSMTYVSDGRCACNLQYREVYWGHQYYINKDKASMYSAVTTKETEENSNRVLYLSIDAVKKYSGIDFSYYFDNISGLYISTISGTSAESFYCDTNRKYIEGRVRYMMMVNPQLNESTAYRYEYLFRHEAANSDYLDQDMLMAICQTESRYIHVAQSEVDAIGLMQVMLMYAEAYGYTYEMIQEPHYNIQFGRFWFDSFCDQCDGILEMGLSAYYMGVGGVQGLIAETGSYSSNYSGVCINNRNMLQSWVAENGYSNEFLEYTGK